MQPGRAVRYATWCSSVVLRRSSALTLPNQNWNCTAGVTPGRGDGSAVLRPRSAVARDHCRGMRPNGLLEQVKGEIYLSREVTGEAAAGRVRRRAGRGTLTGA